MHIRSINLAGLNVVNLKKFRNDGEKGKQIGNNVFQLRAKSNDSNTYFGINKEFNAEKTHKKV